MNDFNRERKARHNVASGSLPQSEFLTGIECDWCELDGNLVLLANADEDQIAAVVRHTGDVSSSQFALLGVGVPGAAHA